MRWLNRPPSLVNLSVNPGNRHLSKIYTAPKAALRPRDPYPEAQLTICRNHAKAAPQLVMTLNDVKNLFVKQLPNMGACYVTRLVYDFEAESCVILHNGQPMAAISSRLFEEKKFIEIVFCAVESNLQSRGYGRLVMAFTKSVVQARGMCDLLTCADNDAVVYFKKQGFNEKEIRMEPDRWVGRIKDYDGVTLVHCKIHPEIDYIRYNEQVLGKQLKFLKEKTGLQISNPIPEFNEDMPALPHGVYNVSLPIPEIMSRCAPDLHTRGATELLENYADNVKIVREKLFRILEALKDDRNSGIFIRPVTEELAPEYFETIQSPMDLFSIENRLKKFNDYYKRPDIFFTDVKLMCDNAKTFNPPDTSYYRNAVEMWRKFRRLYNIEFPDNHQK